MARNEEKQHGRLNRLWLQKEKEEGHIKDVCSNRPRLSALHTALDVKKWIPSIKKDIEYYLEQSQLTHYSDRKIQEFQVKIEELKKEYYSYLWKLRRLDPSCKDHPWKLRGYVRKRTADGIASSWKESGHPTDAKFLCTPILNDKKDPQLDSEYETSISGNKQISAVLSESLNIDSEVQDKPLDFNTKKSLPKHVWLRSSYNLSSGGTNSLKDILLSGNTALNENGTQKTVIGEKVNGILGVDCYSSSEDDC
ncbi:hypothetical protein GDO86_007970 [Hymenochirus boettgeri]|uniref:Uncharacterized protein n=1 Tax=Hymenochirus boettgeri TaxID=247094 RepID=A0A8T2IVS7_9PIPI|nr:hypothetical protein GDO86_007970 [Hymenochirus boettgeri]